MNSNERVLYDNIIVPLHTKLKQEQFIVDKSGVKIVELIKSVVELDPSKEVLDFGIRKTPAKYTKAELLWYVSQDLHVAEIAKHAKIWNNVCSKDGLINSNYGWCVFSDENYSQLKSVIDELKANSTSRRAIMIYTRPSMQIDYCKNGMDDFICTNTVQYLIRNNELVSIVSMRSNDFVFGLFNDFYWQCYVHKNVFFQLLLYYPDLKFGKMFWDVNSMHVYERHFNMLENIVDNYDNF